MTPLVPASLMLVALLRQGAAAPATPEAAVAVALEELRKGEMFLDAEALTPYLAASFTLVEEGSRISGSFAFLEPIRRLRERLGEVKELRFEQTLVRVYGGSAIVTYRYHKVWTDSGTRHREDGWSTDVFELRDDGTWLLIHRHRGK